MQRMLLAAMLVALISSVAFAQQGPHEEAEDVKETMEEIEGGEHVPHIRLLKPSDGMVDRETSVEGYVQRMYRHELDLLTDVLAKCRGAEFLSLEEFRFLQRQCDVAYSRYWISYHDFRAIDDLLSHYHRSIMYRDRRGQIGEKIFESVKRRSEEISWLSRTYVRLAIAISARNHELAQSAR